MNTPMTPQDDDIEALLADDSELLKRYRALPQSEPGKHLDAAILGRAANAVRRPVARQRWLIPIASAASLVAAAGIGWRVHLAQQQDQAAATAPSARYDVMEIDLQASDDKRALDTAVMPPDAPREQSAGGAAAPLAKERPTLSEIIEGPARDNGVIIEPHTTADHAQPGLAPEQRQAYPEPSSEGLLSSQSAPAAAAAPAPPVMQDEEANSAEKKLERMETAGSRRKRDGREDESARALGFSGNDRDQADAPALAPADWIERIRMLISNRRVGQAREEIARFRDAYPSYRLPPDVRRYER